MGVRIDVELPQLRGVLEVEGIAVLFGRPGSGKTWFLKSIYGALYKLRHRATPKEFVLLTRRGKHRVMVALSRGSEKAEVLCGGGEGRLTCSDSGYVALSALYVPPFVEAVVKYRWAPPYSSDSEFWKLVNLYVSKIKSGSSCDFSQYMEAVKQLGGEYKIEADGVDLYEVLDSGEELEISFSSTAVSKLGFLEAAALKGYFDDYDLLLLDDPEAGLHPMALARLALLLHNLASCGKKIILATHSAVLVDMIRRAENINNVLGTKVPLSDARLYVATGGSIVEYDILTSHIPDFSEYYLLPYLTPETFRSSTLSSRSKHTTIQSSS